MSVCVQSVCVRVSRLTKSINHARFSCERLGRHHVLKHVKGDDAESCLPDVHDLRHFLTCLQNSDGTVTMILRDDNVHHIVVVVECIYELCVFSQSVAMTSAECNRYSPPFRFSMGLLAAAADKVTSFGICHKCTCRLLQGPTSFGRMQSSLCWSGGNLEVPSSV